MAIVIVVVVVGATGRGGAWCGALVDVFPLAVYRQIFGDVAALGPFTVGVVAGRLLSRGRFAVSLIGVTFALAVAALGFRAVAVFLYFQQGVGVQCRLNFLLKVEGGEL